MPTYNVTYTPSTGGSLSATSATGDVKAGLLWTEAHLAEWRNRALNGPYKSAGDSFDPLIPAEWDRIVSDKNTFAAAPTADRRQTYEDIQDNGFAITEHQEMVSAAFYSLVKEDSSLATVVKDELMWHATRSGTAGVGQQISPTYYLKTDSGNWWNGGWMLKIVIAASFVEAAFSTAERTTFDAWIHDWASSFDYSVHQELIGNFPNRYSRDYVTGIGGNATSGVYQAGYAYKDASSVLHNQIANLARQYNNRRAGIIEFVGLAGVFLNDATIIDHAKIYVEEWLRYSVYPDGSVGEFERNYSGNVQQGLNYNGINLECALAIAEALRISGDNGLYDYSTTVGLWNTECTTEPAKTLQLVVNTHMDLIEHEKLWYLDTGSIISTDLIDSTSETGIDIGKQSMWEKSYAAMGNRYWKSERIRLGYRRESTNSVPYSSPFFSPGSYTSLPWLGQMASWPSTLFLFADMEDVSGTIIITNPDVSAPITSTTSWQNRNFGTQSGAFNVEFDIVPNQDFMDGLTGISLGNSNTFSDMAIIVRLEPETGTFDARNGDTYTSDATVAYTTGVNYHVRVVANVTTHTYSVFITPDGSPEVLLANNYAFRTDQNTVPSLDTLVLYAVSGSHTVSNFTTGDYVAGQLAQTVEAGEDAVPVTATPDAEYGFVNWTGDTTSTDNPLTLTNIQADTAVTANFAGGDQTLTYTAGTGGSVTGTSPQTVAYGSSGTAVTAVPDANYSFVDWSDSSTQNPRTDTSVSGDVTVTANFTIDTFTLSYSSGANGSLTGTTPQTVDYNTSGTAITAVPETGFIFVDWSDSSTDNPRTDASVTADVTVSASFVASAAEFTVTFAANGGSITGDASQLIVSGEDCTAVTVVPNANYSFTQWSDANTDNPRTVTNVASNQTLTATCVIDTYSVDFTAGTGGSITGTASQTIDHGSDATQVTGTAALYYEFTSWGGDYVGATNPLTITNVTADMAIAATFTSTVLDHTASTLVSSATSVNADESTSATLTVQAKDSGVNATSGGHSVVLVEDGNATINSVIDGGDGTYTATITNATIESVTVSGTVNGQALANTKAIEFTSGLIAKRRTQAGRRPKTGGC